MAGPSRLPLEALRQASRAVGPASASASASAGAGAVGVGAAASASASPSRTSVCAPEGRRWEAPSGGLQQQQQQQQPSEQSSSRPASTLTASASTSSSADGRHQDGPSAREEKRDNKKKAKVKVKQPKWRGTGAIGDLMHLPALLSPVRVPRNPIVLCHGLYGFDVRGPFLGLEIHYWASVMDILKKRLGAEVIIRGVPGTGSIPARAEALHKFLCSPEAGVRGRDLNMVGHSMGGLDARHLISNIRPTREQYRPVSLTTICTPHRGSPFMDWCNANIGIGNDAIEEALREVKSERRAGGSGNASSSRAGEGVASTSSIDDEYQPPPYSLKSPLFVRQKKPGNGDSSKKASAAVATESGAEDRLQAQSSEEKTAATQRIMKRAEEHDSASAGHALESAIEGSDVKSGSKVKTKTKEPESKTAALFDSISSAFSNLTGQLSDYMLSVLDTPAYAMLSTKYMNQVFNPSTPDDPNVKYYSIAARTRSIPIWHPLWLPKLILDAAAESRTSGGEADGSGDALGGKMQGNDGLVSVQSARWGEFLGIVDGCDHWDLRGGGGPRLADGKLSPSSKKQDEKETEKSKDSKWIDVNQLLGLWRAIRPSPSRQGARGSEAGPSRSPTEGISSAHGITTLSKSQQQHGQDRTMQAPSSPEQESRQHQVSTRRTAPLESLQPSAALTAASMVAAVGREEDSKVVPAATAAGMVPDAGDGQGKDSVSDIVQTFMHAYSHLADPKHDDEPDYDWTAAPSFTPTSDQESIITEIAQWISERLPMRDEGRRAVAEKEAAAQDEALAEHEREHALALSALGASRAGAAIMASAAPVSGAASTGGDRVADQVQGSQAAGDTLASIPVTHLLQEVRDADDGDGILSPAVAYRIRHKDEDDDGDADEAASKAGIVSPASSHIVKDVDELELFWLAVCHHLYARGF